MGARTGRGFDWRVHESQIRIRYDQNDGAIIVDIFSAAEGGSRMGVPCQKYLPKISPSRAVKKKQGRALEAALQVSREDRGCKPHSLKSEFQRNSDAPEPKAGIPLNPRSKPHTQGEEPSVHSAKATSKKNSKRSKKGLFQKQRKA